MSRTRHALLAGIGMLAVSTAAPQDAARRSPGPAHRAGPADSGSIRVHLLGHAIGSERYDVRVDGDALVLVDSFAFDDRGGHVGLAARLRMDSDFTPRTFRAKGKSYRFVNVDADIEVRGSHAVVHDMGDSSRVHVPARFFTIAGYAPLEVQALLVRYWERHGRPSPLATVPGDATARVVVEYRGADTLRLGSPERTVPLRRYSVDGVAWGREALWLDESGRFAAIVTRANMLPLEGVREDLAAALPALQSIAIADRMHDLQRLSSQARPIAQGTYALVGARLVDGTGGPPVEDATIVIHAGRIAAAGPRARVPLPPGTRAIDARGKTVLPGLWDMHAHIAAVEWGPAYLGVGVTTARDMGGEQPFLVALRDALAAGPERGLGPRLVLAGLVDGGGPESFGTTSATTPDEGRSVVADYHAAGFQQIKLYTLLRPDVVGAIIRRAHELKMTVTGHIPRAMTLEQAVDSGIDHVAHLPLRGDAASPEVQRLIRLLAQRHIVVDPTISWEELLGHATTTPVSSFQPGFRFAPWPVVAVYRSVRGPADSATVQRGLRARLAIVKALHDAGVRIVSGTDYGIPGQSLLRELELYVQAGLTPMEAIRAATAVPASVMGLDADVGTIAEGKRADLLVLDANPLAQIANIRTGRWVVANGVMYDCAALSRSVGFAVKRRRLSPSSISSGPVRPGGPSPA